MTLREEFEQAFGEQRGSFGSRGDDGWEVDELNIALWAARWALDWLTQTEHGIECDDDDLISIGFIRKRLKELQ